MALFTVLATCVLPPLERIATPTPAEAVAAPAVRSRIEVAADSIPYGLWVSHTDFGPLVRGALNLQIDGSRGRAEIAGRNATFEMREDSIRFTLAGGAGSFRGRIERGGQSIRGFWIRPGQHNDAARASGDRGGPFDQAMATPITLSRTGAGRYRGEVVPLAARFTLFLCVYSDTSGLRAAFRNPEFNLNGGAMRYRMQVDGDSLRFVAKFADPNEPEIHHVAAWDRARKHIRVSWHGLGSLTLTPAGPRDSIDFWPRLPIGAPQTYRAPTTDADGWHTARAASAGFDEAMLARFTQAIADTNPAGPRAPLIHSCLIERRGRLVYEEYFYGYDRGRTHDLRSASKTFASILLGAAMHDGHAIAPESTVVRLMARRGPFANPDPRKARITVADLMSHTTGLACDDGDDNSPGGEGVMQSSAVGDWWKFTLDLPMAFDPGTHYAYCSGGMNLVGGVLGAATGRWLPELFDSTIARPLAFGRYHWNLMPSGDGYLGGGVQLRPRDLLKLGRMYLDGGVWQGRRIVDTSWVRRSTSRVVDGPYGPDGYAWHLNTLKLGDSEYREYEANGNGGQFLIVLPELDISIVFTAANYQHGGIWTRFRSELVPQWIIAALRDT